MKPIFNELIQPMMQTFAVDLIAEIICSERDNQLEIARKMGKDEDWIKKYIDFKVKIVNSEVRLNMIWLVFTFILPVRIMTAVRQCQNFRQQIN